MIDKSDTLALEIAISRAKGISGATVSEILQRVGSLEDFFTLTQAQLHNLTGISTSIYEDAYRQSIVAEGEKEAAIMRSKNIEGSFIGSSSYPQRLAACEDAPVMLYRYGSCDLDSSHMVGIVGTRHATPYGVDFTTHLVSELAKKLDDLVIVSGLAYGIDAAAHRAALTHGVRTVAALGHGLSRIYPADHRQLAARMTSSGGALVCEYPYQTGPQPRFFLARNRIIAGLCDCVVVVESDYRGGAMSTARVAMQYNRDVFAVPGRVNDKYSHGTNRLIANQTAALIQDADDLIAHMGWESKEDAAEDPKLFRALSAEEQQLVDYIVANPDVTVNDICVRLNKSYALISDILFQLEMDDIITTLPGGRYALAVK